MPKKIFNEFLEQVLVKNYERMTAKELADYFGCAESTIKNKLSMLGKTKSKEAKYKLHECYLKRGAEKKREQGAWMRNWLDSFCAGETRILDVPDQTTRNYLSVSVCRWNVNTGRLKNLVLRIKYNRKEGFAEVRAYSINQWVK